MFFKRNMKELDAISWLTILTIILLMLIFFSFGFRSNKVAKEGLKVIDELKTLREKFEQLMARDAISEERQIFSQNQMEDIDEKKRKEVEIIVNQIKETEGEVNGIVRNISKRGIINLLLFLCILISISEWSLFYRKMKILRVENTGIKEKLSQLDSLRIKDADYRGEISDLKDKIENLEDLLRLAEEAKESYESRIRTLEKELFILRDKNEKLEKENSMYYANNMELEKKVRVLEHKLEEYEKSL